MDAEAFPKSQEQCDGYYRRSEAVRKSDYRLNSGWFEFGQGQFLSASLMALAAKQMGVSDDSARLALTHAALRDGRKIGRWEIAAEVISETHGLPVTELLMWARSPEILREAQESTAEFQQLQINQRPAFFINSRIGDHAVFSGLVQYAPLASTIDAMLEDVFEYDSYSTHFPGKIAS